jgi:hypothetical protein
MLEAKAGSEKPEVRCNRGIIGCAQGHVGSSTPPNLHACDGLHACADVWDALEFGYEDAHYCDHGLDQWLWHWLILCGVDTGKCFPKVVLAEVVGPCCHLGPRCRRTSCVALGNAHKFRLLSWPKGGLLDVVFVAQFQKICSRCL